MKQKQILRNRCSTLEADIQQKMKNSHYTDLIKEKDQKIKTFFRVLSKYTDEKSKKLILDQVQKQFEAMDGDLKPEDASESSILQ